MQTRLVFRGIYYLTLIIELEDLTQYLNVKTNKNINNACNSVKCCFTTKYSLKVKCRQR
jgi:hypothetical protein